MKKEKLIALLKQLPAKTEIKVACDEEWNIIYSNIDMAINEDDDSLVLFGMSGSETMLMEQ